jgi:hypothetical protein
MPALNDEAAFAQKQQQACAVEVAADAGAAAGGFSHEVKNTNIYEDFTGSTETLRSVVTTDPARFDKLVLHGIERGHRYKVWQTALLGQQAAAAGGNSKGLQGGAEVSEEMNTYVFCDDPSAVYLTLLATHSDSTRQISVDIPRTYSKLGFFSTEPGATSLANVLHAFAVVNPIVGYVQGMNFIAGVLLLSCLIDQHTPLQPVVQNDTMFFDVNAAQFSAEDMHRAELSAFHLFLSYMTRPLYNMQHMYEPDLKPLHATMQDLKTMLSSAEIPVNADNMNNQGIDPLMYASPYYFTAFAYNVSDLFSLVRLWDTLFVVPAAHQIELQDLISGFSLAYMESKSEALGTSRGMVQILSQLRDFSWPASQHPQLMQRAREFSMIARTVRMNNNNNNNSS